MGRIQRVIQEMVGKEPRNLFGAWSARANLYGSMTTVDYQRNDYDLSRSIYYGSKVNGRGADYLLASGFGKPIVNSTAAFTLGLGFSVKLKVKGTEEKTTEDELASSDVNAWINNNISKIFDFAAHGFRDGDSYIYIDEFGELEELDAKNVEVMLDAVSGEVTGYDVTEIVEEKKPGEVRTTKYKIVKEYRKDSIRYTKYSENNTNLGVIFEQVFTVDGAITPSEDMEYSEDQLVERQLPVIHFANEPEPRAIYGNSEYQNLYIYFGEYHKTIAAARKAVTYNATPIPVVKGANSVGQMVAESHEDSDATGNDRKKLEWGQDKIIYLNGPDADAYFMESREIMGDIGKLLEYYFYLIIEASETPEFVFGTAIQSSRASTETQMPVMLQKANRKRRQMQGTLKQLVLSYVDRQIRLSNPRFLRYKDKQVDVTINYPELNSEDKELLLKIVDFLVSHGLTSDATALRLLLGDKIDDIQEELNLAREDADALAARNNIFPDQPNRLQEELNNLDDEDEE